MKNDMTIKQASLPPNLKKDLRWGSHLPLTRAIIASFPITGALELGAGVNSTPVLFNNLKYVVSIEADLSWIEKLRSEKIVVETETKKLVHHSVPSYINRGTVRAEIDPHILQSASAFYASFINTNLNFLFVDCYAGFRLQALDDLHERFDVIAYHDAEPQEDKWYSYSSFKASPEYTHVVDRTFLAHTGLIVSKKLQNNMHAFFATYQNEAQAYANKFNTEAIPTFEQL